MYTNIEAERARQRISKEKMAEILDISSKTYTNYINGITPIPSNILLKLSSMFGCTTDYLLNNVGTTPIKR